AGPIGAQLLNSGRKGWYRRVSLPPTSVRSANRPRVSLRTSGCDPTQVQDRSLNPAGQIRVSLQSVDATTHCGYRGGPTGPDTSPPAVSASPSVFMGSRERMVPLLRNGFLALGQPAANRLVVLAQQRRGMVPRPRTRATVGPEAQRRTRQADRPEYNVV